MHVVPQGIECGQTVSGDTNDGIDTLGGPAREIHFPFFIDEPSIVTFDACDVAFDVSVHTSLKHIHDCTCDHLVATTGYARIQLNLTRVCCDKVFIWIFDESMTTAIASKDDGGCPGGHGGKTLLVQNLSIGRYNLVVEGFGTADGPYRHQVQLAWRLIYQSGRLTCSNTRGCAILLTVPSLFAT